MPATIEYFYENKKNKSDGLHPKCANCCRKERLDFRNTNVELVKAKDRDYKRRNKEKLKRDKKQWKLDNLERHKNNMKKWQQNNPEKVAEYNKKRQHKNHKITKSEWQSCKDYFKDKDGDYCCAYCGLKLQDHYRTYAGKPQKIDFHKEHVNHNGGDGLYNCIPSCGTCNDRKWEFEFDDFYNEDNPTFTQERYDKILKWIFEDCFNYIEEKKPKGKYTKNPDNPIWKISL